MLKLPNFKEATLWFNRNVDWEWTQRKYWYPASHKKYWMCISRKVGLTPHDLPRVNKELPKSLSRHCHYKYWHLTALSLQALRHKRWGWCKSQNSSRFCWPDWTCKIFNAINFHAASCRLAMWQIVHLSSIYAKECLLNIKHLNYMNLFNTSGTYCTELWRLRPVTARNYPRWYSSFGL